jgi:hypothetical protein
MRKFILSVSLLILTAAVGRAGPVTSIDQITTVVGSGSNEAAFVIDWKNGQTNDSLVWGYRWNGTATTEQMLRALAGADIGIFATLGQFGGGLGAAIFGLGFDVNQNGKFGVSPALTFTNGVATITTSQVDSNRKATDPGDFYTEDFFNGFWGFWLSPDGTNWTTSNSGISGEVLHNGDWDGLSFAAGFNALPPDPAVNPAATAVPEPLSLVLAATAVPALFVFRRRRARVATA